MLNPLQGLQNWPLGDFDNVFIVHGDCHGFATEAFPATGCARAHAHEEADLFTHVF